MTTLIEIPSCQALHIPTTGSTALPLSSGDLILTLLPANPPSRPSQTLTLTIGASSFPVLPNSPIQKIQTNKEHSSYIFSPVPADGGASIGQVKIEMKTSSNQGEWEATEALCSQFETVLKAQGVWEEKTLFVDDEYETGGPVTGKANQGWGEYIGSTVLGAGQAIADRLNAYTDRHMATTNPTHPAPPSETTIQRTATLSSSTSTIAQKASEAAQTVGSYIHEGGKKIGAQLPDSIAKKADPVPESEKSDIRKSLETGWEQVTIAAKGLAGAAGTVAGAVSENAHRAVDHNFGKEADKVAQHIGQTGTNIGSTALSVEEGTSIIIQGTNAGAGMIDSRKEHA